MSTIFLRENSLEGVFLGRLHNFQISHILKRVVKVAFKLDNRKGIFMVKSCYRRILRMSLFKNSYTTQEDCAQR